MQITENNLYNDLSQTEQRKIQEDAKDLAALLSIWITCHPIIRARRIPPVALLVATVLPNLPLQLSLLVGKIILFIFTVDDVADERLLSYADFTVSSKVWEEIARNGNTAPLPEKDGDLSLILIEIRGELAEFPLFSALSDLWANRFRLLTDAMAREYEYGLRYQVGGKAVLPGFDEYIENGIHSVGFPFWGTSVLILLSDPQTLNNLETLNEIILCTGAAIRLYNDVRTYEKEVREGNINAVTLMEHALVTEQRELSPQCCLEQALENVLQRANEYAEKSCAQASMHHASTGQFEKMIHRIVAFHAYFYGSRQHNQDYHTITPSETFLMAQGK
jgi:hypothetical protein